MKFNINNMKKNTNTKDEKWSKVEETQV